MVEDSKKFPDFNMAISDVILSIAASTQRNKMHEVCRKMNELRGIELYAIDFKVVKQEDLYIVTARSGDAYSIDDLRKHVISLVIENFIHNV